MFKQVCIILACLIISTGCTGTMPKLGVNNGLLTQCPSKPNCVSSQANSDAHFIEPITFTGSIREAKEQLLTTLQEFDHSTLTIIEDRYIRAEFSSKIFHFVDDTEFYLQEIEPEKTLIHVRSAARVGYSDFGVNRKRVEEIRKQLDNS